jgi:hypothetical protein
VALVRERTIPTERPPPMGEVSALNTSYRKTPPSASAIFPALVKKDGHQKICHN